MHPRSPSSKDSQLPHIAAHTSASQVLEQGAMCHVLPQTGTGRENKDAARARSQVPNPAPGVKRPWKEVQGRGRDQKRNTPLPPPKRHPLKAADLTSREAPAVPLEDRCGQDASRTVGHRSPSPAGRRAQGPASAQAYEPSASVRSAAPAHRQDSPATAPSGKRSATTLRASFRSTSPSAPSHGSRRAGQSSRRLGRARVSRALCTSGK